jgi:YD repeat-containing protein
VYTYSYTDTLLTGWKYHSSNGDSSRTEFQYDARGRLIRQSYFEHKMLQGGGTQRVMTPDGWREEPIRRWEQTSLINYSYDDKGRKILYDATRLHYSAQNMYRWEYDEQGRIASQTSYSRGKITWKEDYQYFDWGYRYWRTWYDGEGNLRHEYAQETPQYYPLLFYHCTVDKQGRITEERVTDEKQKLQYRTVTTYDAKGRIAKTIRYNADNKRAVTHVYVYS